MYKISSPYTHIKNHYISTDYTKIHKSDLPRNWYYTSTKYIENIHVLHIRHIKPRLITSPEKPNLKNLNYIHHITTYIIHKSHKTVSLQTAPKLTERYIHDFYKATQNIRIPLNPIYRMSWEECARLRENVPQVKIHRYNPKHLYPKLNGYGDNGERSLKVWQLLHTYWLPNTY